MGRYIVADLFLDPWVNAWYSIPAIAFVPLVMNWTGLNYAGSIVIAFLIAVFSIILNVYSGIKNTNRSLVETSLLSGKSISGDVQGYAPGFTAQHHGGSPFGTVQSD